MKSDEQKLMELLNHLQESMQNGGSGEYSPEGLTSQSQEDLIAGVMKEAVQEKVLPYVLATKMLPELAPMLNEVFENIASLKPAYEKFRDFLQSEIRESVLGAYDASLEVTGGNQAYALELTKVIIEQGNRLSNNLNKSVDSLKKQNA